MSSQEEAGAKRDSTAMGEDDLLVRMERWYAAQCDGVWEHASGVGISTLDNPGWALDVSLAGTRLESVPFETIQVDRTDTDWYMCRLDGAEFKGRGGPGNLTDLLTIFLDWADAETGG